LDAQFVEGGPSFLNCENDPQGGNNLYIDGSGHFTQIPLPMTLTDPGGPASQCGDLTFNNRTRTFSATYATSEPGESPYKYWWRRGRRALDGISEIDPVREVAVPVGVLDVAEFDLPLSIAYDAVGALLILEDLGGIDWQTWGEIAFTDPTAGPWDQNNAINLVVQHWRHINPPVLNSVTVDGSTVTLNWTNGHQGRTIDSTIVFREGVQISFPAAAGAATSWVNQNVGVGTYRYSVKHFSVPVSMTGVPNPNSGSSNPITIVIGTACARLAEASGSLATYKVTDQYLSAGCSLTLGPNKRYRWFAAGDVPLSGWSADTLLDFAGHSVVGQQIVILKDSNTTTYATSRDTLTFAVTNNQIVLSGPTFILDKQRKSYAATAGGSPHAGHWYQRFDDGLQWFSLLAGDYASITRIWPMGEYTVELRQHRLASGVLRRGRLHIEVCSSPGAQCQANAPVALTAAVNGVYVTETEIFGAGPVISWGPASAREALRLYDLWGMPDRDTPFADAEWVGSTGGKLTDTQIGWELEWISRDLGLAGVQTFDFSVSGGGARRYTFGMAVDPDLGANAADDVASYDPSRGLVLVTDPGGSMGFLLRQGRQNGLASAQEYGVGRWAPTTGEAVWGAQRTTVPQLVGTPRDVQLLLSAAETAGNGTWTFAVIRGATPSDIRASADAVLRALK
jgi:hypothetical protein